MMELYMEVVKCLKEVMICFLKTIVSILNEYQC